MENLRQASYWANSGMGMPLEFVSRISIKTVDRVLHNKKWRTRIYSKRISLGAKRLKSKLTSFMWEIMEQ